jgi:hypothetical protein
MLLFQTYNSPFHGGLGRSVAKRAFRGPVWTVARACTAAPTYFDPVEIQALDGRIWRFEDAGLQVNNPTEVGIEEVKSWNQNPKSNDVVHAVVSIGTGEKHSSMFASNRSIFPFNEARALGQGILDGSLETTSVDNRVRDQLRQDGEDRKYWRFNDDSIEWEDIKLDDYRSDALRNMEYLISRYMEEHKVQKDMKSCAGRLVKQRHERIRTSKAKWERFADATEFICNVPGCFIRYNMADDSESHFEKHHQGCEKKVRRLRWTYK